MEENGEWFGRYHAKHPEQAIGLSEYGVGTNPQYQSANPEKGDYTETYQVQYGMLCERIIKELNREYVTLNGRLVSEI